MNVEEQGMLAMDASPSARGRVKHPWLQTIAAILCIAMALPLTGSAASGAVTYTYDELGRLKTVTYSDGTTTTYSMDAAGNRKIVADSVSTSPDTFAPTVPGGFSGVAASPTLVNLSWTASSDTGGSGLAGYKIERCEGAACTAFAQIGVTTALTFGDATVIPSRTYRYRIRAYDFALNHSAYTTTVNVALADGFIQLTNSAGAIIAYGSGLYTTSESCVLIPLGGTICTWLLKKNYGTLATVWSTAAGPPSACPAGPSGNTTAGYQRLSATSCQINVLGSVYGQ